MPGLDGTGPLGQGPMTGRGQGFCALTVSKDNPGEVKGFVGLQSVPVSYKVGNIEKDMINMPFGDRTGPAGLRLMTGGAAGSCAGYPVPGYINPAVSRIGFNDPGIPVLATYGAPYGGWISPWIRRGISFGFSRGFGRGWARGHGTGRFGYW